MITFQVISSGEERKGKLRWEIQEITDFTETLNSNLEKQDTCGKLIEKKVRSRKRIYKILHF